MIQNDFTIYPKTKVIRHTSGTTVYTAIQFYSWLMNTFDEPGYLTYETPIKFNTPQSFTMINRWFLDNGDGSNILQYLTGGGIDTTGYDTAGTDKIYMMDVDAETTEFVAGDLDQEILDDTNPVGPLLSFKANYPSAGLARFWVRDTNSNGTIGLGSNITMTSPGLADYSGNTLGPSVCGDEIYHNLYTIASFPTDVSPQVYIYQSHPVTDARTRILEWSAFTNWDRGTIDVLIPVQLGGTLIDTVNPGKVSTFIRQTGDTYTYVESTLNTSGRTPIATETSADEVNITKGEHYLLYNTSDTGSFTADDIIQSVATGGSSPPTWYAEVVAVTEFTNTATGVLTLRGLKGTITSGNAIYVGATQEAVANGAPGDTYVSHEGTGTEPVIGDIDLPFEGGTSTAHRVLKGYDNAANKLVMQVYHTHGTLDSQDYTGTGRDVLYKDFSLGDVVNAPTSGTGLMNVTTDAVSTTLISGYSDVTVAHMNGTIAIDTVSGNFTLGERVTWTGGEAKVVYTDNSSIMFLGNVTAETNLNVDNTVITGDISDKTCQVAGTGGMTDDNLQQFNFALQNYSATYSVFIEGGSIYNTGRSLSDIYGYLQFYLRDGQNVSAQNGIIYTSNGSAITQTAAEEYIKAATGYAATKAAPFGTLAGGVFFGAQGVWLQGMQSADNNKIKLTDSGTTLREPFITMDLVISNTRVDDRVAVYLENGSTTFPDKDTYTSHATNNVLGDSTFERNTGAMPNDTPTAGTIIVVDASLNKEHRYRYTERNSTTDPAIFTLPTQIGPNTSDGATTGQTLQDVGEDFSSTVQVGDIIHRTSGSLGFCYATAISTDTITTTLLEDTSGTAATTWTVGDTYEIHSLVVTYVAPGGAANDTFFVPYMDFIETTGTDVAPGSQTVTLTYGSTTVGAADREVVIEARNVKNSSYRIVPFKTTQTITSTGMTQSVIRTQDTVYA